jgi:hypothetical protein
MPNELAKMMIESSLALLLIESFKVPKTKKKRGAKSWKKRKHQPHPQSSGWGTLCIISKGNQLAVAVPCSNHLLLAWIYVLGPRTLAERFSGKENGLVMLSPGLTGPRPPTQPTSHTDTVHKSVQPFLVLCSPFPRLILPCTS